MVEQRLPEDERPIRRRRAVPPRLYLLARAPTAPWVQLRRLGSADRGALLRHLLRLRQHDARDAELAHRLCEALDLEAVLVMAAVTHGEVVASAIALDLRPKGVGAAATLLPGWRGQGLRGMLRGQLVDTAERQGLLPAPLALAMAGTIRRLGGQVLAPDDLEG